MTRLLLHPTQIATRKLVTQTSRAFRMGPNIHPKRAAYEFYPTPPEATRALLSAESFDGDIWEPACGEGHIAKVLTGAGYSVTSTDLIEYGFGEGGRDFLAERAPLAKHIVTNPPYGRGLADAFAKHVTLCPTNPCACCASWSHMDAVDRFFSIERTLRRLQLYEDRLTRLFFAKALRDRQLARVKRRWRQLSDARNHALAVINANPHLKQRLERRQSERLKAESPPDISDAALIEAAQDLTAWRNRERDTKDAFQDAVVFVKWGQDQHIPLAEAEAIREQLRAAYIHVRHQRLQRQVAFENQFSRRYTDAARAIHERERALEAAHEAAAAATTPSANMFAEWYQRRTGQLPPEPQNGKAARHSVRRLRLRDDDRSS